MIEKHTFSYHGLMDTMDPWTHGYHGIPWIHALMDTMDPWTEEAMIREVFFYH
jgi:hypothetical protein